MLFLALSVVRKHRRKHKILCGFSNAEVRDQRDNGIGDAGRG